MVSLKLKTTTAAHPDFLTLPWHVPLADWPDDDFVRLPAGEHRHVVRFLDQEGVFYALKELPRRLAEREFEMLEFLRDQQLPCVTLVGIATGRHDAEGEPLEAALITKHLSYSLPYRNLFGGPSHAELRHRLIDALVVLLVRLHVSGFFWGDCSLNNALFRRDAGALRAYVVDTETAEVHEALTDGQRRLELDVATENLVGGLLDLQAGGRLHVDVEPADVAQELLDRYESLWAELTTEDELPTDELWRVHARLSRLNELGFDTTEYELQSSDGRVRFRPTVIDEGHHKRELERLTGIVAHENQARRLLSALRGYGGWLSQQEGQAVPEAVAAYRWLSERWQPTLAAIPDGLRGRLEDAEVYHQILEHAWFLSEQADREIPLADAAASYVATVLSRRPDERLVIETP